MFLCMYTFPFCIALYYRRYWIFFKSVWYQRWLAKINVRQVYGSQTGCLGRVNWHKNNRYHWAIDRNPKQQPYKCYLEHRTKTHSISQLFLHSFMWSFLILKYCLKKNMLITRTSISCWLDIAALQKCSLTITKNPCTRRQGIVLFT